MPTINLLPWREELRKQRQQNFGIAMVAALALAALVGFAVNMYWDARISHQNQRNALLEAEIAELDKKIEAIAGLERKKERSLSLSLSLSLIRIP